MSPLRKFSPHPLEHRRKSLTGDLREPTLPVAMARCLRQSFKGILTPEQRQAIAVWYFRDRIGVFRIARELGVSRTTIYYYLDKLPQVDADELLEEGDRRRRGQVPDLGAEG